MKADYIQHMGSDLTVVNAARVSFDKESEWEFPPYDQDPNSYWLSDRDKKLVNYLARHNHFTPFTHQAITIRETVPIFVARQRFKHTVGFSYNEVSRRYVDDIPEFFAPNSWRGRAENAKQGSGEDLPQWLQDELYIKLVQHHQACLSLYLDFLDKGVCPEQARMVLPQSMYTSYYVSGSLAAWARAYSLRIDSHSQKEIQLLAAQWGKIIQPLFPVSWGALTNEV